MYGYKQEWSPHVNKTGEKREADEDALRKDLSELGKLRRSAFRKFLEKKLNLDMALWLGEENPGADTLDWVTYFLAFVFLACLITLSIVSGSLVAAPLILPSAITILYSFYRLVMSSEPRQKQATTEQNAFIELLEEYDDHPTFKKRTNNNKKLFYSFKETFESQSKSRYIYLIEKNEYGWNFLHFALNYATPTALRSFIQHPLGTRIANFLINQRDSGKYTPLMQAVLLTRGEECDPTIQKELINILLELEKIDLNLIFEDKQHPLLTPLQLVWTTNFPKTIILEVSNLLIDKMPIDNVSIEVLEKSKANLEKVCEILENHEDESKENSNENKQKIVIKMNEKINQIDKKLEKLKEMMMKEGPSSQLLFKLGDAPRDLNKFYKDYTKEGNPTEQELLTKPWEILEYAFQKATPTVLNKLIARLKGANYLPSLISLYKFEEGEPTSPLLTWVINPERLKEQKSSAQEIVAKVTALIEAGASVTGKDDKGNDPLKLLTELTDDLLKLKPELVGKLVALLIKERDKNEYTTDRLKKVLNSINKCDWPIEEKNNALWSMQTELRLALYRELCTNRKVELQIPDSIQKFLTEEVSVDSILSIAR